MENLPARRGTKRFQSVSAIISAYRSALPRKLPGPFDAQRFKPVMTLHHAVLLKTMALEGRGVAWLAHSLVSAEMAGGRLVGTAGQQWDVPLEVRLFRTTDALTPTAETVWAQVARKNS